MFDKTRMTEQEVKSFQSLYDKFMQRVEFLLTAVNKEAGEKFVGEVEKVEFVGTKVLVTTSYTSKGETYYDNYNFPVELLYRPDTKQIIQEEAEKLRQEEEQRIREEQERELQQAKEHYERLKKKFEGNAMKPMPNNTMVDGITKL